MSFYSGYPASTPPFVGGMVPILPPAGGPSILAPVPGPSSAMPEMMVPPTPYDPGPYCFGLDSSICGNLPEKLVIVPARNVGTVNVISEVSIPLRDICKGLTNTTCAILVVLFLVVVLGVALQGLLNN